MTAPRQFASGCLGLLRGHCRGMLRGCESHGIPHCPICSPGKAWVLPEMETEFSTTAFPERSIEQLYPFIVIELIREKCLQSFEKEGCLSRTLDFEFSTISPKTAVLELSFGFTPAHAEWVTSLSEWNDILKRLFPSLNYLWSVVTAHNFYAVRSNFTTMSV